MFKNIRDFFDFNRSERNSIVVLGILLILIFLIPALIHHYRKPEKQDIRALQAEIRKFEESLRKADPADVGNNQQIDFERVDHSVAEQELTPFSFNPNEMKAGDWKRLGLKDWQVRVLTNYTSKGGRFYKKEDFQKIYGISKAQYEVLAPFINIPEQRKAGLPSSDFVKASRKIELIDLNTADSVALLTLNGIGPSFAKRIIKFRNLLGGFYNTSQLLEVYGFDSARYEKVNKYCFADPSGIEKIHLNKVTTDELRKHPYFDYYLAKAIVDRRIIVGKYTSLEQVAELPLVHSALFDKIKNYLTTE